MLLKQLHYFFLICLYNYLSIKLPFHFLSSSQSHSFSLIIRQGKKLVYLCDYVISILLTNDESRLAFIYYLAFLLLSAYDDTKATQMYTIALQQLGVSQTSK